MSKADVSEMALKIRLLEERDVEPIGGIWAGFKPDLTI